MFTDAVRHGLLCRESTFADKTEIGFMVETGGFYVSLSKGIQFQLNDQVEVMVRVDRNQLRSGTWRYSNDRAFLLNDSEIFNALLTEIRTGERIAIRVGNETGNVVLDGSTEAVEEFRRRIAKYQISENNR